MAETLTPAGVHVVLPLAKIQPRPDYNSAELSETKPQQVMYSEVFVGGGVYELRLQETVTSVECDRTLPDDMSMPILSDFVASETG